MASATVDLKTQKLKNRKTFAGVLAFFGFLVFPFFSSAYAGYDEGMEAYRKAWAAFAAQRYEDARHLTAQAINADPNNPHAHALSGDLAYLAHDLEGARRAWKQALSVEPRLRPLQERLQQAEQELALEAGQHRQAAGLFVIISGDTYLGYMSPENIPEHIVKELEAAQAFLEQRFQTRLSGPITVLVYEPEVFSGSLHVPTEVAGLFDGKIRIPGTRHKYVSPEAVIWHELAHVAVHQLAEGRATRWVHEGVAQLAQAQVDSIPTEALQIALRGRKVPTVEQLEHRSQEIGQATPMEAGVFYQAAWAHMADLEQQRGWAGVGRLLQMLAGGMSTTEALEHLTSQDANAWQDQWHRWISEHLEKTVSKP